MKKLFLLFSLVIMLYALSALAAVPAYADDSAPGVGSTITWGTYHSEPIVWRVLDYNSDWDEWLLISEYILDYGSIDINDICHDPEYRIIDFRTPDEQIIEKYFPDTDSRKATGSAYANARYAELGDVAVKNSWMTTRERGLWGVSDYAILQDGCWWGSTDLYEYYKIGRRPVVQIRKRHPSHANFSVEEATYYSKVIKEIDVYTSNTMSVTCEPRVYYLHGRVVDKDGTYYIPDDLQWENGSPHDVRLEHQVVMDGYTYYGTAVILPEEPGIYTVYGSCTDFEGKTYSITINFEIEAPPSPVQLYAYNNNVITTLYEANGSLFGSRNVDGTGAPAMKLKFDNMKNATGNVVVDLPPSFSFEFNTIEQSRSFSADELRNNYILIYPMNNIVNYSEMTFRVRGAFTCELKVPLVHDNNSNIVYCRASQVGWNVPLVYLDDLGLWYDTSYNERLAWMGNTLSQAAYNQSYAEESLRNLGYTYVRTYGYENSNTGTGIACTIGQRSIMVDYEIKHCLALIVRGTYALTESQTPGGYWIEWAGDFDVYTAQGRENLHQNFLQCADSIDSYVSQYLQESRHLGCPITKSNSRLFVTGHSRGAAVAALYSHYATSSWESLTCYTFATPNHTQTPAAGANIYNIMNLGDLVAFVPGGGNWGKYGRTYVIGNTDPMTTLMIKLVDILGDEANEWMAKNQDYRIAIGKYLSNMDSESANDSPVGRNHGADMYLSLLPNGVMPSYILSTEAKNTYYKTTTIEKLGFKLGASYLNSMMTITGLKWGINRAVKAYAVHCPVDVTVKTATGKVVATFVNHELAYMDYNYGLGMSADDGDYLLLNADSTEYVLEITANDNGTMSVYSADIIDGSIETDKLYEDVPIARSASYVLEDGSELTRTTVVIASGTCGDNLTWQLDNLGVLTISGTGAMDDFDYDTMPWVDYRNDITSVVIEEGVTSIGRCAFSQCYSLTDVSIPASVTVIGDSAFEITPALQSIQVSPDSTSFAVIDDVLYTKDLTELICCPATKERVIIPEGVTTIRRVAFYSCGNLTSVVLPDSITFIGNYAFRYCRNLTEIVIPSKVTSIGGSTFDQCSSLTTVTLPAGLTSIGFYAFDGCNAIENVYFAGTEERFGQIIIGDGNENLLNAEITYGGLDVNIITANGTCGDNLTWQLNYVGKLTISGIGAMDDFDYDEMPWVDYRNDITSVVIEEGVTSIGRCAFSQCYSLTDVSIPASVTVIGDSAFEITPALQSILVAPESASFTVIDDVLYTKDVAELVCCPATKERVIIPEGVTTIRRFAFYSCSNLTSVVLPDSVTTIGDNAFRFCRSLIEIVIPSKVTSIENFTFQYCSSLNTVKLPTSISEIGYCAFNECYALTNVYYAGSENRLSYVYIDDSNDSLLNATIICDDAVQTSGMCGENLTWQLDDQGVLTISGSGAMYSMSSALVSPWFDVWNDITEVRMLDGITSISSYAFSNLNITSITIPASVTSIETAAFYASYNLAEINVASENKYFTSYDGILFDKQLTELICCPCGKLTADLPAGLKNIDDYAFYYCYMLQGLTIPESVQSIGAYAFFDCESMAYVNIPEGVTSIERRAFQYCMSLTNITIPSSVTSIDFAAFASCYKLTEIVLPEGVESIGGYAFEGCTALKSAKLPKSLTSMDAGVFNLCDALTDVHYAGNEDCWAQIAMADGNDWLASVTVHHSEEVGIVYNMILPADLTIISEEAFMGTPVTTVELPTACTAIESKAFADCKNLTAVCIPNGDCSIANDAFYGISKLTIITVKGSSVETWSKNKGYTVEYIQN